jgi:hypothetical protein
VCHQINKSLPSGNGALLKRHQIGDGGLGKRHQLPELLLCKRLALGGALNFDDAARCRS